MFHISSVNVLIFFFTLGVIFDQESAIWMLQIAREALPSRRNLSRVVWSKRGFLFAFPFVSCNLIVKRSFELLHTEYGWSNKTWSRKMAKVISRYYTNFFLYARSKVHRNNDTVKVAWTSRRNALMADERHWGKKRKIKERNRDRASMLRCWNIIRTHTTGHYIIETLMLGTLNEQHNLQNAFN